MVLVSGVELNRLGGEEHEHHHEHEEDHGVQAHEHGHEHEQEPRNGRTELGLADLENQIFSKFQHVFKITKFCEIKSDEIVK